MPGIVWLASYPKSGNTWLRIFLAHLLGEDDAAFDLNGFGRSLHNGLSIAAERAAFDEIAGLASSELLPDEIDLLRPRVYEAAAAQSTRPAFVKVHDAYLPTPAGEPMLSPSATQAAVYIVRNPLDVAVSLAFHAGVDFDQAIGEMADPGFAFCNPSDRLRQQLRQRLSSWSCHVESWIDAPGVKCHVMRYEDMVAHGFETFAAAVRFLDLSDDEARIRRALEGSRFDRLKEAEAATGFVERSRRAQRFFREGRAGGWRDHLAPAQAGRIIAHHGDVMRRLGYLGADGSVPA
jgi:Sulfotransferase domain